MKLGAILPISSPGGGPLTATGLADGARALERHGFDSAWVFDAIGRGFALPDPLIALSIAATVTERIGVGTCILQVPLRRPVELAHRILTAHLVSGGRLLLGVGSGSTATDFAAVGVDFAQRNRALEDAMPVIRALLAGDTVDGATLSPWPDAVGGPPVLIGSWGGEKWIRRTAETYDGWIASAAKTSFTRLADAIGRYRAAGGRRAVVTNITVDLSAPESELDHDAPFTLACPPAEAGRRLAMVADLGFDDAVLVHGDNTEENLAAMRALI